MSELRESPTRLEIERWLLGELTDAERSRVESALSTEEQARLRREDGELRSALLARQSPAEFARRVRARRPARRSAMWIAAPALTAAAALVAVLQSAPAEQSGTPPSVVDEAPGERSKGLRPQIHVYRRTERDVEELHEGATVHPHDLLQLGYVGAGRRFGALISIDGAGAVTTHLPSSGSVATALAHHGEQLLPSAYELDAAPRFERFLFVTADEPFDLAPLLDVARKLPRDRAESGPLPLAPRFAQQSLRLRKELP
jgi:hypothetical protein